MIEILKEIYGRQLTSIEETDCNLPNYLKEQRKILKVTILNQEFIVVELGDLKKFSLDQLKKQYTKYWDNFNCPIVFSIDTLITYQRKIMIRENIPFISKNNQVFLPFLGSFFLKCPQNIYENVVDKFMPATQCMYLFFLYMKKNQLYSKSEISKVIDLSPMSITRAARDLVSLGLIEEKKEGRTSLLYRKMEKSAYYQNGKTYLINPIQRRRYIKETECNFDKYLSGETALAHRTDLSFPKLKQYAVYKKESIELDEVQENGFLYVDNEVEVQEWKYNPGLFSIDDKIDPVSLIMTFENERDERIISSLEDLEKEIEGWEKAI